MLAAAVAKADLVKSILAPNTKGQFRIALGVRLGKEAVVGNRNIGDYDLTEGVFRFRTPLDLPANTSGLIPGIEETTTGVWGSTNVEIPGATPSAS